MNMKYEPKMNEKYFEIMLSTKQLVWETIWTGRAHAIIAHIVMPEVRTHAVKE